MIRFAFLSAAALAAIAASAPASAVTTTLDFAGDICGPSGGLSCGNGSEIGANYGDSAGTDVSYRSILTSSGATFENYLKHWGGGYGDLTNVVWGGVDAVNYRSEITFAPAAGFEIRLIGFDAGCYQNRGSCQALNYSIASGGSTIQSGSTPTLFPGHASIVVGGGYFSGPITLTWGPDGYDTGLDNIVFDVRAIGNAIPEPATWAMLIAGFGLVGATARRRASGSAFAA